MNYKGTFIDGKEFDSSAKTGSPAKFSVKGVIPGLDQGPSNDESRLQMAGVHSFSAGLWRHGKTQY